MRDRTAFLFPGLGAYSSGVLRQAHSEFPQVGETFAEIDDEAARHGVPSVSDVLFGPHEAQIKDLLARQAELLQLAIFGTSIATYRVLIAEGAKPHLLVGHSFGEMAALVCAGAFDLTDGVRLVCARTEVLRPWEGRGAMAAIGANETVVEHLIGLVEEPDLVIGCTNAPRQTVLSGPIDAIARAGEAAEALGFFFAKLHLPYASHHPSMRPAVSDFLELMATVRQRPLRQAVLSPIHGRRYDDGDDLRQAIADCLVLPVRFTDAVRTLHAQDYHRFVEIGALNALTRCVRATVPGVQTFAPLLAPENESAQLRAAAGNGPATAEAASTGATAQMDSPEAAVVAPIAPQPTSIPSARREAVAVPAVPARAEVNEASRPDVLLRLQQLYATALEYPVELLTEGTALEAELGVDSLKQTSLLAKVIEEFGLHDDPGELRVWEFASLGHIADHVVSSRDGALR
ncbi:acyltransferase domain-containing protein [Amycolatopsis sp. H20-H5]|uniref:acyltransferase domain-containing protein n=1 Tax=Amycolatopsis sp. H20-H5 TaxID=3046309 RepID=UPI002DB79119|nr:acyltransferase domain-containing protein [Amycolatopsis sp. H20-H5]MEC3974514.1 acyltransferase domain-containing protein [Amycolatopsis sp. H20-H5]